MVWKLACFNQLLDADGSREFDHSKAELTGERGHCELAARHDLMLIPAARTANLRYRPV